MKDTNTEEKPHQDKAEWRKVAEIMLSNEQVESKFSKHFLDYIEEKFLSQQDEWRKKIEKKIDENDDGMWAGREYYDEILELINSK